MDRTSWPGGQPRMGKYDVILWHQGLKQPVADILEAHTSQTEGEVESKSTCLSSCNSRTAVDSTLYIMLKIF